QLLAADEQTIAEKFLGQCQFLIALGSIEQIFAGFVEVLFQQLGANVEDAELGLVILALYADLGELLLQFLAAGLGFLQKGGLLLELLGGGEDLRLLLMQVLFQAGTFILGFLHAAGQLGQVQGGVGVRFD